MDTATTLEAPAESRLLPQPAELSERNARLIALLDSFELGNAEQQRQDLAALQAGVEEARPGQRRVFSEGINP